MAVKTIDSEACIGCGTCVETCPMDVFRLNTSPTQCDEYSPCRAECPLGCNQREYHNLLKLDRLDEAAESLSQYHPMPIITGYICPHTCESVCTRKDVDVAININGIEQYLGIHLIDQGVTTPICDNGKKVAIIGGGPAGLSAAYFLRTKGYGVTVFDKENAPGGMLRTTIPAFRLPVDVLDAQIAYYENMGIQFQCNTHVGKDITVEQLKTQGFDACIATVGADKPFKLPVANVDAKGITTAMDYLRGAKDGTISAQGGKVAIIGGGSVALDSARSALRLGAEEVYLFCLETIEAGTKDSMLAPREEIEDAMAEGVILHGSHSVHSFEVDGDGAVCNIKFVACTSVRDEDGRFNPQYGDVVLPEELNATTVVLAIGQGADGSYAPDGFATTERGYLVANRATGLVEGSLFAAGDGVTGPSTVVKALAAGKRTATNVDHFLKGEALEVAGDTQPNVSTVKSFDRFFYKTKRVDRTTVPAQEAKDNFDGTMQPLSWYEARTEANRCMTCGSRSTISYMYDCQACSLCVNYCPTEAITVAPGHVPSLLHAWDSHSLVK